MIEGLDLKPRCRKGFQINQFTKRDHETDNNVPTNLVSCPALYYRRLLAAIDGRGPTTNPTCLFLNQILDLPQPPKYPRRYHQWLIRAHFNTFSHRLWGPFWRLEAGCTDHISSLERIRCLSADLEEARTQPCLFSGFLRALATASEIVRVKSMYCDWLAGDTQTLRYGFDRLNQVY